jgi:hypothetical protein
LGRSRGGFSTKLHVLVNGLGLPVELKMTPGQAADITEAESLLAGHDFDAAIGDKGFSRFKGVNPAPQKRGSAAPSSKPRLRCRRSTWGYKIH